MPSSLAAALSSLLSHTHTIPSFCDASPFPPAPSSKPPTKQSLLARLRRRPSSGPSWAAAILNPRLAVQPLSCPCCSPSSSPLSSHSSSSSSSKPARWSTSTTSYVLVAHPHSPAQQFSIEDLAARYMHVTEACRALGRQPSTLDFGLGVEELRAETALARKGQGKGKEKKGQDGGRKRFSWSSVGGRRRQRSGEARFSIRVGLATNDGYDADKESRAGHA